MNMLSKSMPVPSPDTMAQLPRSWPPNTGCDPVAIVGGVGDHGPFSVAVPADLQVVTSAAEQVRGALDNRERALVIRAIDHLDASQYARQAGAIGAAEVALAASRRVLCGLAGISDEVDTEGSLRYGVIA